MRYNINMRFEVPQFIEVEDKIIGPFTWKQFVYLAGGAGAAITLYLLLPFILFVLFGVPIMALAGFLAFRQINNRPFSIFLESVVQYFTGKRLYLWKKQTQQTIRGNTQRATIEDVPQSPVPAYKPPATKGNIATLASKLELNSLEK